MSKPTDPKKSTTPAGKPTQAQTPPQPQGKSATPPVQGKQQPPKGPSKPKA
jgi:hypothetical protein